MQHSRNRDLDGVRGLAILLVVAAHSGLPVRWGGLSGVTLFFVLSGYLITSLLIREWDRWGSISLWRFWGRRAVRLLPALLLLIALTPLLLWATADERLSSYPVAALASLFYVGNWVRINGTDLGVFNHLWSLSVEEQFYVVWPLVFIAVMTWLRPRALSIAVSLAALATFYSVWTRGSAIRLDISTETNAFALLLGVSLAFGLAAVRARGWEPPAASPLVPFVVLVAVSAFPGHGLAVDHPLFRPLATVHALIGLWLVYAAVSGHSRVVASRFMVFFGTISYALYLWHQTFINSRLLGEHTTPRNLALIAAAILVSWLSWVLLERPAMRLRGPLRLDQPSARQQAFAEARRASDPAATADPPARAT
ncbi:acyltransferase family protein [Humibacillus xanthopallidus]|uniref:acyltransferase family protein n=1 Tax=Humibacillus xanthopallidus TaxID=412689 RepID=UPI00384D2EA2